MTNTYKPSSLLVLCLLLLIGTYSYAQPQIITTYAGIGYGGYSGDGGAATAAEIPYPTYMCHDVAGNWYVTDGSYNVVRKISPSGVITRFAGTVGSTGYSGDGGPATAAELSTPMGIACDATGNIYIADHANNHIRKVSPSGIISTFAGTGTPGYSGDGGPATAADINAPNCIVADAAGNIYISDGNHTVRMVNPSGIISTFAGTGTAGFSGDLGYATAAQLNDPHGLEIDGLGYLYIADTYNRRVRRINTSGIITTFAGGSSMAGVGDGGPATAAGLLPMDVRFDRDGNFFISDLDYSTIRVIPPTGIINTYAGNYPGFGGDGGSAVVSAARMYTPTGLSTDTSDNVYVCDFRNHRIRMITPCSPAIGPITIPDTACLFSIVPLADTTYGGTWSSSNSSVAYIGTGGAVAGCVGSGTATIYYTYYNGCSTGTVSHPLTVLPGNVSGTISLASGRYGLCAGTADSLVSSSTYGTGTWWSGSPGIATVSPTGRIMGLTMGSVWISYSVPNRCQDTSTVAYYVDSLPPTAGGISGPDSVCVNKTITLTSTSPGGVWSSSNNVIASVTMLSGMVRGRSAGPVTIKYKVSNSCGADSAYHTVYVRSLADCNADVDEINSASEFNFAVYPTISQGSFHILLSGQQVSPLPFSITDVIGRIVKTGTITSNQEQPVTLDAPPGTYIVSVVTPTGRVSQCIIVSK